MTRRKGYFAHSQFDKNADWPSSTMQFAGESIIGVTPYFIDTTLTRDLHCPQKCVVGSRERKRGVWRHAGQAATRRALGVRRGGVPHTGAHNCRNTQGMVHTQGMEHTGRGTRRAGDTQGWGHTGPFGL